MPSPLYQVGNYNLNIYFRHGSTINIQENLDDASSDKRYVDNFRLGRGVNKPSYLSLTMRDIGPRDKLYSILEKMQGTEGQFQTTGEKEITWKQVLEVGNAIEITVNEEFRGIYFVSTMQRATNDRMVGYQINCIGVQEWLRRQSAYWSVTAEALYLMKKKGTKSKFLSAFNKYVTVDKLKEATNPKKAIEFIINNVLVGFVDTVYSPYSFTNGDTISDLIGLALSDVSYYEKGVTIIQSANIAGGSDYSIWDAVMQYQSSPFHEVFVTTGGRKITLYDYALPTAAEEWEDRLLGEADLEEGKEYIIFRPVPYDHPAINDKEILGIPGKDGVPKTITPGAISDLSLNTVEATHSGITLGAEHIIESNLMNSDDNLYSEYKLTFGGPSMAGGVSDGLCPPIVDDRAMRQVGHRTFTASLEGLDSSSVVKKKKSKDFSELIQYFRILQGKLYNWFKYNAKFNKGSVRIQWIPDIYEGVHIDIASGFIDEDGIYYLSSYDMEMDSRSLTYSLEVTRGFPHDGYKDAATDYKATASPLATATIKVNGRPDSGTTSGTTSGTNSGSPSGTSGSSVKISATPHKKTSTSKISSGTGSGPKGAGKYTYFVAEHKTNASATRKLRIDNVTGDIYDVKTGKKAGNIKTFNVTYYLGIDGKYVTNDTYRFKNYVAYHNLRNKLLKK